MSAAAGDEPDFGPVQRALENFGYDLEIELGDARVLRDRRQPTDYGEVTMTRLHGRGDGAGLHIQIVSADNGPEFYEELARYLIVELARQLDDVTVAHAGMPALSLDKLASELSARPLGLLLLP